MARKCSPGNLEPRHLGCIGFRGGTIELGSGAARKARTNPWLRLCGLRKLIPVAAELGCDQEAHSMKISTLLARKGTMVATISGQATVREAVAELRAHGIGALVVSADGEHIEGIVSERDIVRALADRQGELLDEPVSSIMTSTVFTGAPEDDTDSLMAAMTDRRIRHVPIATEGSLRGIVSIGDVVKSRIDDLEKDRRELTDYINAR